MFVSWRSYQITQCHKMSQNVTKRSLYLEIIIVSVVAVYDSELDDLSTVWHEHAFSCSQD